MTSRHVRPPHRFAGPPPGPPMADRPKYNAGEPGARPIVGESCVAKAGLDIELLRCGMASPVQAFVGARHQPALVAHDQPDQSDLDLDVKVEAPVLGALKSGAERRKR